MINRRSFIETALLMSAGLVASRRVVTGGDGGQTLQNGVVVPATWPPRYDFGGEPGTPPYLSAPPPVIPIDVGRQLFVDDFLIDTTTLARAFHKPVVRSSPVLTPEQPWEDRDFAKGSHQASNPTAAVFSDAVLWDPHDRLFKMWYMGGYTGATCYATSHDGIRWTKPRLDVVPGTNIVNVMPRDSSTVWIDPRSPRDGRFKMASSQSSTLTTQKVFTSADGIHWMPRGETATIGDRTTFFFNPFRQRWVFSIRAGGEVGGRPRHRRYVETAGFESPRWTERDTVYWTATDALDPRREDFQAPPQLYNLDCVAYESLLLGLFSIWRGEGPSRHKHVDVCLGFSRDGFHWSRPDRQPILAPSEDAKSWYHTNVQSAGGGCLVVGPRLYFYFSGRSGRPGTADPGTSSTGLATLRRDGFVSMTRRNSSKRDEPDGQLTTRPLSFTGRYLFVNADCSAGELRAEVVDTDGRVVPGFSKRECRPLRTDSTHAVVGWERGVDVSRVSRAGVRLRFFLTRGHFYSFWVAHDLTGASLGYPAMGGPGIAGEVDAEGETD